MKKIITILSIALAMAAAFTGCDDSEDNFIATAGVSLSETTLTINTGDFVSLTANVTPSNASSTYKTWTSSNTSVASVDSWGRVYGVAPGEAVITVETASGGYTATCVVTVNPIRETSITLSASSLVVYYDESETLTATIEPSDATYTSVTWSSANPEIASVDASGKVTGVDLGTTTITATSYNGLTATCNVSVEVRMPTTAETVDLWKSDNAGFRGLYGANADEGKSAGDDGWLYYESGAAYWAENTTGKVRTATLELSTGSSITITQLSGADFKGNYTFTTKLFDGNKRVSSGSQNTFSMDLTFGDPRLGETLSDANGNSYTNTIGIEGLYVGGLIVEACVDIDYDAKTMRLGVMFDGRSAQKLSESINGYEYAAFLPELCTSASTSGFSSPWAFVVPDMGEPDYEWMWFKSDDMGNKFYLIPAEGTQQLSTVHSLSTTYICGMSLVLCSSEECTASTVASSYDVIYQYNTGNSMTTGMTFVKL